jgi:hypothetical protein
VSGEHTIFIDRSFGRHAVANALRQTGQRVEIHDDHFPMDATDEEWLAAIGKRGWLCLTKDVRIGRSTLQRLLVARHRVKLFVFMTGNLTGPEMGSVIAKARDRMLRLSQETAPPFIAKIYATAQTKIWRDCTVLDEELSKAQRR